MKVEEVIETRNHMFNLFLAVSPEIFIINATFILLIHGVVFSTSKKDGEVISAGLRLKVPKI